MKKVTQNMELFTNQGCLTIASIKGFISGGLSEKQLENVKNHISSCELCREAVEGARKFSDIQDFEAGISELRNNWNSKSVKSKYLLRRKKTRVLSIAATITLLIGLSVFYLINKKISQEYFSDIMENGMDLDSAMTQVQIHPASNKQDHSASNDSDTKSRNSFISDSVNTESAIPLGKIAVTRVYARSSTFHDTKDKIYTERKQIPRSSHLSYPNVVMHLPPSYINLNMPEEKEVAEDLFVVVEEMPKFRGADLQSFREYIQKRIIYPRKAIEQNISGRVYAQFTIDKSGKLIDPKILNKVHPAIDSEVIRVLNDSPIWQPGKQRDRPVCVSMIIPVDFYLY